MRAGTERKASGDGAVVAAKTLLHAAALLPLVLLGWKAWLVGGGGDIDALGADPVAAIEHELGLWALRLLLPVRPRHQGAPAGCLPMHSWP